MLPIQDIAARFYDGSIIAASPIVVGAMMEPARIVIRDVGQAYIVHLQCWPVSEHGLGRNPTAVKPFYVSGNYFPKEEAGALNRAWDNFCSRYCLLVGREDRLAHLGKAPSCQSRRKAELATEIRRLTSS
jgi:hypothetical protein